MLTLDLQYSQNMIRPPAYISTNITQNVWPVPTESIWEKFPWCLIGSVVAFCSLTLSEMTSLLMIMENSYVPHWRGGGHIVFGADPVGIGVGVTLSCMHDMGGF